MIMAGVVCLLLGILLGVPILYTIGVVALVIGLVLLIAGSVGRPVGGRSHYW